MKNITGTAIGAGLLISYYISQNIYKIIEFISMMIFLLILFWH